MNPSNVTAVVKHEPSSYSVSKAQMLRGLSHFLLLIHTRTERGVRSSPRRTAAAVLEVNAPRLLTPPPPLGERVEEQTYCHLCSSCEVADGRRRAHLFLFLSGSCVLPLLWPVFAEADLEMLSALRRLLPENTGDDRETASQSESRWGGFAAGRPGAASQWTDFAMPLSSSWSLQWAATAPRPSCR